MPDSQIIDTALFSGSADTLRTVMGGYWEAEESEYGTSIDWVKSDTEHPGNKILTNIYLPGSEDSIESEIINSDNIIPGKRFPIRIASDRASIVDDTHWRAIMLGGSYGENSYPSIYNETLFQYLDFKYEKPYPKITATEFANVGSTVPEIEISYDYSDYLALYEGYAKGLDSELLIPNYYILADLSRHDFTTDPDGEASLYPNELINFVNTRSL